MLEKKNRFAIGTLFLTYNKQCLSHFLFIASLVDEEVQEDLHEDFDEELDDLSSSFSMSSASTNDDASLERRLDDAYESGKETYSEGNKLLSQVNHGVNNDSIMNDETAHKKHRLDDE
jgi:hypothetical protein